MTSMDMLNSFWTSDELEYDHVYPWQVGRACTCMMNLKTWNLFCMDYMSAFA